MDEFIETNRRVWDELVPIHVASDFYDVAAFKAGRSTLMSIDRAEVGDVRGKSLLHLQCHFGLDTLSWSREGASVTGVDFSLPAITTARNLAAELDIPATFLQSDIYRLPENLQGSFDIVYASYGVLCWLPDFPLWAKIAARFVKPGGFLYIMDGHPMSKALDDEAQAWPPSLRYPYFEGEAQIFEDDGSYADRSAKVENRRTYEFQHSLGEVLTSLIDAGLRIEFLHEFPFAAWEVFPGMRKRDDGYYELPSEHQGAVPFTFSVRASRPG